MTVLRDNRKFLVSIPEVEDSPPNSEDDGRRDTSSELEGVLLARMNKADDDMKYRKKIK